MIKNTRSEMKMIFFFLYSSGKGGGGGKKRDARGGTLSSEKDIRQRCKGGGRKKGHDSKS